MKILDELWYGNISPFQQCTRGDKRLKELLKLIARNREDRVCQDTRGMRGKARRADQNHESGNCGDEKGNEERIRKEGRPRTVTPQNLRCRKQRKEFY